MKLNNDTTTAFSKINYLLYFALILLFITRLEAQSANIIASGKTSFCKGGSVNLSISVDTFATYQWQLNDTDILMAANSSSYTANQSGLYKVVATPKHGSSIISNTISVTVTIPPTITVAGTNPDSCVTARGYITISGLTDTGTYTINYTDNIGKLQSISQSSTNDTLTIPNLVAGMYRYISVTLNTCSSNVIDNVLLTDPNPPQTPSIDTLVTTCSQQSLNLYVTNPPSDVTYNWNSSYGNLGSSSSIEILNVGTSFSGLVTVNANYNGCISATATITVVVDSTPLIPKVSNYLASCSGMPIVLSATNGSNKDASLSYEWSGPNGFYSNQQNPVVSYSANLSDSGVYAVNAISTVNGYSCISLPSTIIVAINSSPTITATSVNPTVSGTATGSIIISGLNPDSIYLISYNDPKGNIKQSIKNASNTGTIHVDSLFEGNYTNVTASYIAGCSSNNIAVITLLDPNHQSSTVTGSIMHPLGKVIPSVTVRLNDTGSVVSNNGAYSIHAAIGSNYTLTPSKNNDVNKTNGVTVLDAILVQAHILGKALLNSPYKIIAADVDNSGSVTVLDIIYMKRLILGIDTTFKGNRLWAFVDSSYKFTDSTKPFPHKDSITLTNITTNQTGKSFIGVKLGDVNWDWNSATAGISTTINKPIELYYNNINTTNESEIRVPIRVNNFKDIFGMQYTLNYNKDVLELKSIENNPLDMEYGANHNDAGKVSFIWADPKLVAKSLHDGDVLMELVFTKKGTIVNEDVTLTNDIAPVEAWKSNYTKVGIVKTNGKIAGSTVNAINVDKWNVVPNPSNGVVKANLSLTQSKDIQFQLTTLEGKVIMTKKVSALKGNSTNTLNLQQQTKLAAGVYYLKAVGIEGENTKRIVIE